MAAPVRAQARARAHGSRDGASRSLRPTSLVAPAVQLVRSLLDLPREPVISVAAGVLFLLVLARLAGMVRLQEVADREPPCAGASRNAWRRSSDMRRTSSACSTTTARITYVSPSGAGLLGRRRQTRSSDRRWDELVHPDDAPAMRAVPRRPLLRQVRRSRPSPRPRRRVVARGRDACDEPARRRNRRRHRPQHERCQPAQGARAPARTPGHARRPDVAAQAARCSWIASTWRSRADGAMVAASPCCSSTSTTSKHSTTPWATPPVTGRSDRWPRGFRAPSAASDSAARLGGDEFALLLDAIDGPDEALQSPTAASRRWRSRSSSTGIMAGWPRLLASRSILPTAPPPTTS